MPLAAGAHSAGLILIVIGVGFVVVPILLIAAQRGNQRRRAGWAATALRVPGEVLDLKWRVQLDRRATPPEVHSRAFPVLRYTPPGGEPIEVESFEGASPPVAKTGAAVTVLVDPQEPNRARVEGDGLAGKAVPVVLGCLAGGLGTMGLALVVVGVLVLRSS